MTLYGGKWTRGNPFCRNMDLYTKGRSPAPDRPAPLRSGGGPARVGLRNSIRGAVDPAAAARVVYLANVVPALASDPYTLTLRRVNATESGYYGSLTWGQLLGVWGPER